MSWDRWRYSRSAAIELLANTSDIQVPKLIPFREQFAAYLASDPPGINERIQMFELFSLLVDGYAWSAVIETVNQQVANDPELDALLDEVGDKVIPDVVKYFVRPYCIDRLELTCIGKRGLTIQYGSNPCCRPAIHHRFDLECTDIVCSCGRGVRLLSAARHPTKFASSDMPNRERHRGYAPIDVEKVDTFLATHHSHCEDARRFLTLWYLVEEKIIKQDL